MISIETLALVLSFIAPIFYILGYLPGLKAFIKEKTDKGVGNYFWEFIVISVGISFITLIVTSGDLFNLIVVGINLLLAILMLIWKNSISHGVLIGTCFTVVFLVFGILIYLFLGIPINVLQTVATIAIILAYVNQITHFFIFKTAKGVSKNMYLVIGLGILLLLVSMIINGIYLHVLITELVNLILIVICYVLTILYARTDRKSGTQKIRET